MNVADAQRALAASRETADAAAKRADARAAEAAAAAEQATVKRAEAARATQDKVDSANADATEAERAAADAAGRAGAAKAEAATATSDLVAKEAALTAAESAAAAPMKAVEQAAQTVAAVDAADANAKDRTKPAPLPTVSSELSRRVALVIGNGAYASPLMPQLPNPPRDAVAIGSTLKNLGFDVDVVTDATKQTMEDALGRLARKSRGADVTLIFYAGHAIQDQGKNYFAPVDATLSDETDLRRRFIRLDDVLDDLAEAKGARILLLDACRDNGAVEALRAAVPKFRSVGISRGLATIPKAEGQLVAFATQPDRVAADGEGADSPFTTALMAHLGEPGIELRTVLTRVRVDVAKATNNDQIPEVSDSLLGEIYLQPLSATAGPPGGLTSPVAAPPANTEIVFWQSILNSTSRADFEAYLAQYPNGSFVALARTRLAALEPAPSSTPESSRLPACDGGLVASVGNAGVAAAAERCLTPKDVFRDCENCPEMVVIPAGTFTMGSASGEKDRFHNEGPQHQVQIEAPFAVGKFEITRGQFAAFINDTGYKAGDSCWIDANNKFADTKGRSFRDPGFKQEDSHPVVCISWDDANAYVAWLAKKTGKPYRLLSEAEWEYAARAGTTTPYPFGNDPNKLCSYGNGADLSLKSQFLTWTGVFRCRDGYVFTAPVGSFLANGFGLYDMSGNAWEWLEDCYHDSYTGAPKDGSAWIAGDCSKRLLRGGAWNRVAASFRSAYRSWLASGDRINSDGFRVARTLTP